MGGNPYSPLTTATNWELKWLSVMIREMGLRA
jgi:hypothetical protein